MEVLSVTEWSHRMMAVYVREGDTVIDATAGNGHDTHFLARLVGPNGKVFSFDIQEEALAQTRKRLEDDPDPADHVTLLQSCHTQLREQLPDTAPRSIKGIMYNLGYLPGGDRQLTTTLQTTLASLEQALELLAEGGILTVVCYPGHDEGAKESAAVSEWIEALPGKTFGVVRLNLPARKNAPYLLSVIRRKPEWAR